jgi:hypothetical protein
MPPKITIPIMGVHYVLQKYPSQVFVHYVLQKYPSQISIKED